jgi:hypothetical protein
MPPCGGGALLYPRDKAFVAIPSSQIIVITGPVLLDVWSIATSGWSSFHLFATSAFEARWRGESR